MSRVTGRGRGTRGWIIRPDRHLRSGGESFGEKHGQVVGDQGTKLVGTAKRSVGDAVVALDPCPIAQADHSDLSASQWAIAL
jgi:hypothetical protein